jgi:hypothetical protein
MICLLPVTVEPFQFSPAEPVAYELSYKAFMKPAKNEKGVRLEDSFYSNKPAIINSLTACYFLRFLHKTDIDNCLKRLVNG